MKNDCAFCNRTQFEERLIAETDEHYVIATLGQIEPGYTLIAPKEHISCIGALPNNQIESWFNVTYEIWRALSLEYQCNNSVTPYPVTIFEHGIVGQTIKHAHLHLLPKSINLTPRIRTDFPTTEIEELRNDDHFRELYKKRLQPYLLWTTPCGVTMVCWNPPAPLQYLRIITAELLGRPERANWRTMDPELDKQLWQETVKRLKPYFQSTKLRW